VTQGVRLAWSRTHGEVERLGDPPNDGTPSAGPSARGVGGGDGGVTAADSLNLVQNSSEVEL
jgi:hypothetical protein